MVSKKPVLFYSTIVQIVRVKITSLSQVNCLFFGTSMSTGNLKRSPSLTVLLLLLLRSIVPYYY